MIDNFDTPKLFRNAYPTDLFNWDDCELAINRSIFLKNLELVDFYERKPVLKKLEDYWFNEILDINFVKEKLNDKHTFVLLNMSCFNKKLSKLCYDFETKYNSVSDVHVYGGMSSECKSFGIHCDAPDNIIIQTEGRCEWFVFNDKGVVPDRLQHTNAEVVLNGILEPGDSIFIPSLQYHLCRPLGKRISLSIPLMKKYKPIQQRGWINLRSSYE